MRLLILAGERCARLLDARMRNLKCNYIQCDEIWTFCFKTTVNAQYYDLESTLEAGSGYPAALQSFLCQ